MALTEFLQNLNSYNLGDLAAQALESPQTITGGSATESGLSTRLITNQIESIYDRNLLQSPQFQFENIFTPLFNLGEASKSISSALAENISIREDQRQADLQFSLGLQEQLNDVNERLSGQVTDLGNAVTEASNEQTKKGFFESLNLPSIGTGAAIVGAAILGFLLLRKK